MKPPVGKSFVTNPTCVNLGGIERQETFRFGVSRSHDKSAVGARIFISLRARGLKTGIFRQISLREHIFQTWRRNQIAIA